MKNIKKYKLVINRSFYPDILIFPCPAVDCYNRVQGCYVKSFTIFSFQPPQTKKCTVPR